MATDSGIEKSSPSPRKRKASGDWTEMAAKKTPKMDSKAAKKAQDSPAVAPQNKKTPKRQSLLPKTVNTPQGKMNVLLEDSSEEEISFKTPPCAVKSSRLSLAASSTPGVAKTGSNKKQGKKAGKTPSKAEVEKTPEIEDTPSKAQQVPKSAQKVPKTPKSGQKVVAQRPKRGQEVAAETPEIVQKVPKTPKSTKKVAPTTESEPEEAAQSPTSAKKVPKTPKSAKKVAPIIESEPGVAAQTPKSAKKVPKTPKTGQKAAQTPKSEQTVDTKTPKSANKKIAKTSKSANETLTSPPSSRLRKR